MVAKYDLVRSSLNFVFFSFGLMIHAETFPVPFQGQLFNNNINFHLLNLERSDDLLLPFLARTLKLFSPFRPKTTIVTVIELGPMFVFIVKIKVFSDLNERDAFEAFTFTHHYLFTSQTLLYIFSKGRISSKV